GFFVPPAELATTAHGGVSLLKGRRVKRLCPDEKKAYLDDNTCVKYDKCLIATGGKPKTLPELENSAEVRDKVVYLRGVEDYRKLESMCSSSNSITVVGGGFLGSELAYSIHRKYGNVEVNQLVAEDGLLSGILPDYLSSKAAESLRENGVNVITNAKITSACVKDAKVVLEVNGTQKMTSDCVVVAIGVEPDTSIAKASGLEVDDRIGGIVTDTELRVRSGVWAAGDAASFYDRSLGRRRIEHWENAQATDKENYDRGVVFYKGEDGKVVGVLLLNVFGSGVDVARRIIEEGRSIEDFQQLAKLFSLYKLAQTEDKEN
ncbi:pyridine nucleotide-disulfide oxidoreductase, partial [Necator americanus]